MRGAIYMKIMIIDDDQTTIAFLKKILQNRGIQTEQAKNGQEALERIETSKPDLIISDIMMPELDGFSLYERLRESCNTADIPFIFLSAKDEPEDQLKGLRMGADEYLLKPFNAENILTAIDKVMEKAARVKGLKADVDIGGNLETIGLNEVVQIIELSGKTGKLVLLSCTGDNHGTVYIRNGNIINARVNNLEGEEAFFDLADMNKGFFTFYICDLDTGETIFRENMALLMDASRLKDDAAALFSMVSANTRLDVSKANMSAHITESAGEFQCIADLIQDDKTISEIISESGMSRVRTSALLAELIHCGIAFKRKPLQEINLGGVPNKTEPVQEDTVVKGGLVKLIKRLNETRFTGKIDIRGRSAPASIDILDGIIVNAAHGEAVGKKALFRIFSERGGSCSALEGPVETDKKINASLDELIIEAGEEIVWRKNMEMDFSAINVLIVDENIKEQASIQSDPPASILLEAIRENTVIQDIIEASPFSDLETCRLIDAWHKRGLVEYVHGDSRQDIP